MYDSKIWQNNFVNFEKLFLSVCILLNYENLMNSETTETVDFFVHFKTLIIWFKINIISLVKL